MPINLQKLFEELQVFLHPQQLDKNIDVNSDNIKLLLAHGFLTVNINDTVSFTDLGAVAAIGTLDNFIALFQQAVLRQPILFHLKKISDALDNQANKHAH